MKIFITAGLVYLNLTALALAAADTNVLTPSLSATDPGAAWTELQDARHQSKTPAEWRQTPPSKEDQAKFYLPIASALADKAKDFYTRFPADTNAMLARKEEMQMTSLAMHLGETNLQARRDAEEKSLLADPKLTENDRFQIRQTDIAMAAEAKESEGQAAVAAAYETGVRALGKEFPNRPEVMQMLLQVATMSDAPKARALLQEITNSTASDEVKESAVGELKKLDGLGKPIDLQFTAVDGRAVDVSKMKGKVVLIDFWATWCGPCVGEVPTVKEAYDKHHSQGFEIVGISLDREKSSLTDFTSSHKMEWPQFFDNQRGQNKYASQFGINTIPAMWLVDKKGNLRDINARSDLSSKVEKLLAE